MTCLVCTIASDPAIQDKSDALTFGFISGLYLVMRQRSTVLVEMQVFAETACELHAPFVRSVLGGLIEDEDEDGRRKALVEMAARTGGAA